MRNAMAAEEDGCITMGECAICRDELYLGQQCYHINGETICEDCLFDYAKDFFRKFSVQLGRERT